MKTMTVDELTREFDDCADKEERLTLILELGDELEPLGDEHKVEVNRVRGCTSNVWMIPEVSAAAPGKLRFRADSDSQIVRGLIAILLSLVNERTPEEIAALDLEGVFNRLELARYISRSRSNGLSSMVQRVRDIAQHCQSAS
ncbi:MAG: SufE family protein [Planctomycetaceae bacterium]|nr:SufE family protein [Planctomycetaceae bacterium]